MRNRPTWALVALLLAISAAGTAIWLSGYRSQEDAPEVTFEYLSQVGGFNRVIAVQPPYAYVGIGSRVDVVNISAPAQPWRVSQSMPLGQEVSDIVYADDLLYVATVGMSMSTSVPPTHESKLLIMNAVDPQALRVVGSWTVPGQVHTVDVKEGKAFLAVSNVPETQSGELQIVDVSDPLRISVLSTVAMHTSVNSAQVFGQLVYVAAGLGGFKVLDATDPRDPRFLWNPLDSPLRIEGDVVDIQVVGARVYLAVNESDVMVIDMSAPLQPTVVGEARDQSLDQPWFGQGFIRVVDDHVYRSATAEIDIWHIEDSGKISKQTWFNEVADVGDFQVLNHIAYVASGFDGLIIFDLTDPLVPLRLGVLDQPRYPQAIAVEEGIAVMADHGLTMVDVNDPRRPKMWGHLTTISDTVDIKSERNQAYLLMGTGMYALDLSDPEHLRASSVDTGTAGVCLAIADDTAFVGMTDGAVQMVDLTDPDTPQLSGKYIQAGDHVRSLDVENGLLYIIQRDSGLQIVDVSISASPRLLYSQGKDAGATELRVVGTTAYIGRSRKEDGRLEVWDVSNPRHPKVLSTQNPPRAVSALAVADGLAFVSSGLDDSMQVLDVSNPRKPRPIGLLPLGQERGDSVDGVQVIGDLVFIIDDKEGLRLYRMTRVDASPWGETFPSHYPSIPPALPQLLDASGRNLSAPFSSASSVSR